MKYFIESKRLLLRPWEIDDAPILFNGWANNEEITKYLTWNPHQNIETTRFIINKRLKEYDEKDRINFAIVLKETDKLIGNCGFVDINHLHKKGEVGLFIGEEENRSKGYGTEALSLLVEYGFNYLNLKNIMLKVFSFNKRAIKSYEKIGFKVFGKRTEDYYLNGKWYDEYFMEILRKEK